MGVNAAMPKYQEAVQNANILMESQRLAQENYRIVGGAKYLNQIFTIQAEMTDATNAAPGGRTAICQCRDQCLIPIL